MNNNTYCNNSFDIIIHLAAKVDKKYWSTEELFMVNVIGTKNLFQMHLGSKFVLISSSDVENEIITTYAKTKIESEQIIISDPKNLVIRLPSVFGPGDTHDKLIPKLFNKYLRGYTCDIVNDDMREYIYSEDAAKEIVCNVDKTGIIRLHGYMINNSKIDTLIRLICNGDSTIGSTPEENHFINRLRTYHSHIK